MPKQKIGVLLVNLGTPEEPTPGAVRRFLRRFLSDRRVVDAPRLIWLPILYAIILTFRPKKVARNYQKIWTEQGSPLLVYSKRQRHELQQRLSQDTGHEFMVELGMTYSQPSIRNSLFELAQWGADKTIVLPLYPQFSNTTTSSVFDQIDKANAEQLVDLVKIQDYHKNALYIQALASSIRKQLKVEEKLIFSFHGVPKRYVAQGDPYQRQCEETARLVVQALDLDDSRWEMTYQSRVGREEWLTPYLDQRLQQLPAEGCKQVRVICPGFSCDCLETLEEIALQNKALFLESGGNAFNYIKALNADPEHIGMMEALVKEQLLTVD